MILLAAPLAARCAASKPGDLPKTTTSTGRRERRRQSAPSARDAPCAQGQQPGGSKTVKDENAQGARAKTVQDKTRDKSVARALGPDVVNDKGQRVPFSRRGWEPQDSDDDDDKTTTIPRASRPAKPGLPM
jgi:hypothetical protein